MARGGATEAGRVTMGAVWDRTVPVLAGRGGMLAGIAATTLFVPAVIRAAAQVYASPGSPGAAALVLLVGVATVVVALWGQLALIAASSDPAVLAPEAFRRAGARLAPALGLAAIALVVVALAFAPVGVVLVGAGLDLNAMAAGSAAAVPPGVAAFVALYTLVFLLAALAVGARLAVLYPVILHERAGIGAFGRAVRLTRGHGLRILGVVLLYAVVLLVATAAARLVVGTIAAIVLGAGPGATFAAAVAASAVAAAFGTVAVVFAAQLYLALRDRGGV